MAESTILKAEDLEDFLEEAISDSIDMDWQARWGARSIIRALLREGITTIEIPVKEE